MGQNHTTLRVHPPSKIVICLTAFRFIHIDPKTHQHRFRELTSKYVYIKKFRILTSAGRNIVGTSYFQAWAKITFSYASINASDKPIWISAWLCDVENYGLHTQNSGMDVSFFVTSYQRLDAQRSWTRNGSLTLYNYNHRWKINIYSISFFLYMTFFFI